MALNKLMHPRNIYKKKRPDFKQLAIKYADFRNHVTQDVAGKIHLDFKKLECLRALTCALLKDDFGLTLDIPTDRLIPTVPQRLNYILWIEDILGKQTDVVGIDIGTGASCIYPLLGCRKNGWSFLATDVDDKNIEYSTKNVIANGLESKITVVKAKEDSVLLNVVQDDGKQFAFCMCNPPFFADHMDAQSVLTTKSLDRPSPIGVTSACSVESIVGGGEVEFVKQMIKESLQLKQNVRIYTTMLGKKSSVGILKSELRKNKIHNFCSSEFCQGRTMRWALAWSFDELVEFPKSLFQERKEKSKPPLLWTIPKSDEHNYTLDRLACSLLELLTELKMEFTQVVSTSNEVSVAAKAFENTWIHQRQKRRQMEQEKKKIIGSPPSKVTKLDGDSVSSASCNSVNISSKAESCKSLESTTAEENSSVSLSNSQDKSLVRVLCKDSSTSGQMNSVPSESKQSDNGYNETLSQTPKVTSDAENAVSKSMKIATSSKVSESPSKDNGEPPSQSTHGDSKLSGAPSFSSSPNHDQLPLTKRESGQCLIRCFLTLKKIDSDIVLELKYVEGKSRDLLYQLLQFFKNRLK